MNIILTADSYKTSHFLQYPPGTEYVYSYIESRGGEFDQTLFFGLQIFLKTFMSTQITRENIEEAAEIFGLHGVPFNREGWEYILYNHNGYLPLVINAMPEGLVIDNHNVLVTVQNTDSKCFWLTSYIETAILRAVWYPSSVATISWKCKQIIKKYMDETSDDSSMISYKLHDFGARGVSSQESAGIGGAAHLINFMGTDTIEGILYARKYYDVNMAGHSIPASEHSVSTSWGRNEGEELYVNRMLSLLESDYSMVAVVADSYNLWNMVDNIIGGTFKERIKNLTEGKTLVIRPDSGNPIIVPVDVIESLSKKFGYTMNSKGYKVLPSYIRVIQGDGINVDSLPEILDHLKERRFSADNIAFGMGGGLLQQCNRDTLRFAMKTSHIVVDNEGRDVYKDPVTDKGKASKGGRFTVYKDDYKRNKFITTNESGHGYENELTKVYEHFGQGKPIMTFSTFEEVRNRSAKY